VTSPLLTFDADARGLHVELEQLVSSRLLIQGSSGAGKSWLIRYLLEQTHGRIQQFVFDPEGEFTTLRERFDYVVASAGGDGDVPAHPDTADLLCRQLVELEASAILDIYDLDPEDRAAFVGAFLSRLVRMPKEQWRSALVVVDEAHELCPEQGGRELPSKKPMELVVSKGRKRGLCAVYATQRLSKLSKNASDLQNILVGYTGLDVDVKRARDILGFDKAQGEELKQLRHEFFAFGPALSREVTRVRSGPVQTHHPKAGELIPPTPPPRGKLAQLVKELAQIPERLAEEEETLATLRARVAELEGDLRRAGGGGIAPQQAEQRIRAAVAEERARGEQLAEQRAAAAVAALRTTVRPHVEALHHALANGSSASSATSNEVPKPATAPPVRRPAPAPPVRRPAPAPAPARAAPGRHAATDDSLAKGPRAILTALAQHPGGMTRQQITAITGYKRSTRDAYIQRLPAEYLIVEPGGSVYATEAGVAALGDFEPLPIGDELRHHWLAKLPEGEAKVLEAVASAYPDAMERDAVTDVTGYKRSTRDAYLQRLAARKLVRPEGRGLVRASDELFG